MEIRRKVFSRLQDESGEERYYSTNEFEYYDEKLFNQRKHNQRRRIAAATEKAGGQLASAEIEKESLNKYSKEIKRDFGGDIDAWIESKKGTGAYKDLKGKYGQKAGQRASLEGVLAGTSAKEIGSVTKKLGSAEKQVESAADQVVNYGKTRPSVQSNSGASFEVNGKKVNTSAHSGGDVKVKVEAPAIEGGHTVKTTSKTNDIRAAEVNAKTSSGLPKNPSITESRRTAQNNAVVVETSNKNGKKLSAAISEGKKVPKYDLGKFIHNNKKALIITGAGLATAGAAAGILAHNKSKNSKKDNSMEIRRKVFSRLQDENGEERLYSTTEFEIFYDEDGEKMFSEKEGMSTAGKVALGTAGTVAATVAALEGANLLKKGVSYKKAVNVAKRASKDIKEAAMREGKKGGNRAEIYSKLVGDRDAALDKLSKGWQGDGIEFVEKANKRVSDAATWVGRRAVAEARAAQARHLSRSTNRAAKKAREQVAKEQKKGAIEAFTKK